jgi:hypothetical protein
MTYDNWKASEPMEREPTRDRDEDDWSIAADSLADAVEALSTLKYAQGFTEHEKALAGDLLGNLLAGLLEHQPPTSDVFPSDRERVQNNLRALSEAIQELAK